MGVKMFKSIEIVRTLRARFTHSVVILTAICGFFAIETNVYPDTNGPGDELTPPCITCNSRQQINVEVNWSPPRLSESLAETTSLAGYRIFLHNVDDNLHATLVVNDPKKDSLVITLSTDVTYILTAVAVTSTGIESVRSTPREYRFGPSARRAIAGL